jgi:hypothetical protein
LPALQALHRSVANAAGVWLSVCQALALVLVLVLVLDTTQRYAVTARQAIQWPDSGVTCPA